MCQKAVFHGVNCFFFCSSSKIKDTCCELSCHVKGSLSRQQCKVRKNGNLRDGSHLHKCIIMLSDHADTQRHEVLVKLAVQKSALLLNVALQRVNRCEDTMTDTLQTFLKTERSCIAILFKYSCSKPG